MTTKINTTTDRFSAHVDFADLEMLGWEFGDLYEDVARAKGISLEDTEAWEKENYHVRLFNNGQGVYWIPSHNESGDAGDAQWPGDAEKTDRDIQELYRSGLLWDIFEGEN